MFGLDYGEILVIAIVALVVIGPKDLPRVLRTVGQWVGKGRAMARHFRTGVDAMIRESELEEMHKQWAAQNAQIMAQYPQDGAGAAAHAADPEAAADAMLPLPPEGGAATREERQAMFAAQDAALTAPSSLAPPGMAAHSEPPPPPPPPPSKPAE